jgi:hypothetical protein
MRIKLRIKIIKILWCILVFGACQSSETDTKTAYASSDTTAQINSENVYPWFYRFMENTGLVYQIPVPDGFKRVEVEKGSFADWLRFLPLKPSDSKVQYYNGEDKYAQSIHEAIIDIDLPEKDIQASEDAILRLRAEYLYGKQLMEKITFPIENGDTSFFTHFLRKEKPTYVKLKKYLEQLAPQTSNTALSNDLEYVLLGEMQIGDVFVQGGQPGHAAIVVDMAENEAKQKVFLLAHSFIPTQDIYIVKNLDQNDMLGAWFPLNFGTSLYTPEWEFSLNDLRRF